MHLLTHFTMTTYDTNYLPLGSVGDMPTRALSSYFFHKTMLSRINRLQKNCHLNIKKAFSRLFCVEVIYYRFKLPRTDVSVSTPASITLVSTSVSEVASTSISTEVFLSRSLLFSDSVRELVSLEPEPV